MSDEPPCENVYCNWVGCVVKMTDIAEACKEHVHGGRCMMCALSPQIVLGMSAADLLRNIRG